MLQIGPAINGTALRDATGLINFNDFLNQIEYANAATELNNQVKATGAGRLRRRRRRGQDGELRRGLHATAANPALIQVTPVELEAT